MMPVIIQNVSNEYTFTFEINDLEYKEERVDSPILTSLAIVTGASAVLSSVVVAVALTR